MEPLQEINEYLFYEFGLDLDEGGSRISATWPFNLQSVGIFVTPSGEHQVYRFDAEGEPYYAIAGRDLTYVPVARLSLADLRLEAIGAAWVAAQEPIDLETVRIGDEAVPSLPARRSAIQEMADAALGGRGEATVLEGLFLRRTGGYLALVEGPTGAGVIVGTGIVVQIAPAPDASPHRRLALGVGLMLDAGQLDSASV